jgi:hypothetical protein
MKLGNWSDRRMVARYARHAADVLNESAEALANVDGGLGATAKEAKSQ